LGIIAISFLLCCICIHAGHTWGDDFAMYIAQAQGILHGNTADLYLQNKIAMDSGNTIIGPYLYPEGFPLLLSPVYAFCGMNFIVLKFYCSLFFIGTLFLLYLLLKDTFTDKWILLVFMAGIAFQPELLTFSDEVLSDLPFMFFSTLCLLLFQRNKHGFLNQLIISFCLITAYSIRETAIVLLPVLFIYQVQYAFRKNNHKIRGVFNVLQEEKSRMLPYFIFGFFFFVKSYFFVNAGKNHLSILSKISIHTISQNITYYKYVVLSVFPLERPSLIPAWLFFVFALIGVGFSFRKHFSFIFYTIITLLVYLLWPFQQGMRYLFPVVPFFIFFFLKGICMLKNKKVIVAIAVLYVSFTFMQGVRKTYYYCYQETNDVYTDEAKKLYSFIQANTLKNDLIVFFKPRALRLFTGRNSFYQQSNQNILASKAAYLLEYKYEEPLKRDTCFRTVYASANFTLYKIVRN
jgi:hypothetical protein